MSGLTGARAAGTSAHNAGRRGWTPAQWFCLIAGLTLVAAGLLGFIADATFDTGASGAQDGDGGNQGGALQGDSFLGFEVNGWHNIVHLLSGLFLLSGTRAGVPARTIALMFGVIYAIVTIIGLIDGNDVLGILPVNPADNVLHAVLSIAAFAAAAMTRDEHVDRRGLGQDRADEDARAGVAGTTDRDGRTGTQVHPSDRVR